MDEKRLAAFEKMLGDILSRYDSTVEKMAKLRLRGVEPLPVLQGRFSTIHR